MKQKNIKTGFITLFSVIALGTIAIQTDTTVNAADLGTPLQSQMYDPTPAPQKFLNIWMTNGYALQPDDVTNAKIGDTDIVLNTDVGRSVASVATGLLDAPHYRWLVSNDGKNWASLPEWQYGHRANLPVDTSKQGTTWYQLDTQYYNYLTGWALKTHIYSNIAQVNILPDDVQPESVKVSTDTNYIYNTKDKMMNDAYAHAVVTPANATGKLSWSLDTEGQKKATIDSRTGKITAKTNTDENNLDPQRIKVIGTYTGSDTSNINGSKTVSGSSYVTIGGGLNNVTIKNGQTATLKLQGNQDNFHGNWNNNEIWVEWSKKNVGEKDSKSVSLGSTKTMSMTTQPLTISDNGQLYRAKIIMRNNGKQTSMTTGWAKVTVTP